jgi:hypothetical protein
MPKDPAFLFYDGDAARDVSHMNRLERGCYFDLIQAQRKFGGYTLEQAKKILGKDFDSCWEALTLILQREDTKYFIEWVKNSIEKREKYCNHQRDNINKRWNKEKNEIPTKYQGITSVIPLENEDGIKRVQGEKRGINNYITPKLFEEFWNIYPKKVDKGKALTAWNKLCRKNLVTLREIKLAIHNQKKSERWQDKTYIPHPATWVNQSRWLDDPKEMKNINRDDDVIGATYHQDIKYLKHRDGKETHSVSGEIY